LLENNGALVAGTLPRVIETPAELKRLTREIGPLLDKGDRRRAEEAELCRLVLKLIDDYQTEQRLIPRLNPHELLQALLEESGKRQTDLLTVFGSRSRVSDAVNGKREISKAQAKRLGQLFNLSPAALSKGSYHCCPRHSTVCSSPHSVFWGIAGTPG
jgi:HTH-type transcriptional regulator/antitoxin HigA